MDFLADAPTELRNAVRKKEIYQRYLQERERVGDMADERIKEKRSLNDREMISETRKLEALGHELEKVIAQCHDELLVK